MIDLSYIDIHGNRTRAQETANSYIICEPGNYCLPLVYGCGIKNGKNNKPGYTIYKLPKGKEREESGEDYFPYDFLDYKNKPIQGPEIKKQILGAKIVSFDNSREIIKNLRIKSGYLMFSVLNIPEEGANYILGALDKSSRIVWSWHIWLWKDELKNIEVMGGIKLLSENLGTFKTSVGQKYSWLYQWGRKDPLYPACGHKRAKIQEKTYTIGEAIQNPDILVGDRVLNFWTDDEKFKYNITPGMYCNFWNSKYWEQKVEKTIYDPCPPGYHIPEEHAFRFACPEGFLSFYHCPPAQNFPTVLDYNKNNIFTFSRYPNDYTGIELLMGKVRYFIDQKQSVYHTAAKYSRFNTVISFVFWYDGGKGYLGTSPIVGSMAAYIRPQQD